MTSPASPSYEHIARRAAEIWKARGQPVGCDLDIWLEAERQLKAALTASQDPTGNDRSESGSLAEQVKELTAAESVVEYQMSPAPPEDRAIKAAVQIENATAPRKADRSGRPGATRAAASKGPRSSSGPK